VGGGTVVAQPPTSTDPRDAPAGERAKTIGSSDSGRFRGDVEGLRAVAIGLVLRLDAGLPFTRAGFVGVDVFFVISGFLITTLLVSELDRTKTISSARAKRVVACRRCCRGFNLLACRSRPSQDTVAGDRRRHRRLGL
jgi:hypothetical protein